MNMTLRGLGYTFGLVAFVNNTQAMPVVAPVQFDKVPLAVLPDAEPEHLIGGYRADYSALSEIEWADAEDEHTALLANSIVVSRSPGL